MLRPLSALLALAGGYFGRSEPFWGGLLASAAAVAALVELRSPGPRSLALLALLLLGAAGWHGAAPASPPPLPDGALRFRGLVAEDPSQGRMGPRLLVDVDSSAPDQGGRWAPTRCRALVQVVGRPEPLPRKGDVALFRTRLRPPLGLRNPGAESFQSYLGRKGVEARASAPWPGGITFAEPGAGTPAWLRWRRDTAAEILRAAPGQPGAVLNALLLGDWSGVSPATSDSFRAAGTTHLVAISGLHLGILAMLLTPLWRRLLLLRPGLALGRPVEPLARTLTLPFLAAFAGLSGFQTTTLRALAMTGLLIVAGAWSRPANPLAVLCSAVLLLALPKPAVLADPGLQLSMAALVGLFWLSPRFEARLSRPPGDDRLAPPPTRLRRAAHAIGGAARRLVCASLAASLVTLPVAVFHFGSGSLLGLVVNPLAVPLVEFLCLPVALLGLALSPLSTALAALLWSAAGKGIALLLLFQDALAPFAPKLEWAPLKTPWGLVGALALVGTLGLALAERRRLGRILGGTLVGVVGLAAPAFGHWAASAMDRSVHVWALDVGQGQALLLRLPNGLHAPRWVLVDAGGFPGSDFDTGERVVAPALEALGCDRLWLAVSTHPHPDHLGGLPSAVRLARPSHLWLPGSFIGDARYEGLLAEARGAGSEIRWIGSSGASVSDAGVDLRAAWVDGPTENDRSLVLRVSAGGRVALLPADVQAEGQGALLASRFSPPCDLLLAPHHGAANAVHPPFLAAARPSLVVISAAGRRGLPSAEFLEAARKTGAEIRATYEAGCIEVALGEDRLRVRGEAER